MSYIKRIVSNDAKYKCYHGVVFGMLIITGVKLHTTGVDGNILFVLFVILIQLSLFCCINTSNHYTDIPSCCYLVIAWTSCSTCLLFIPYVVINMSYLTYSTNNTIDIIYFIGLCIYIRTVLYLINWYYLSSKKFAEVYCWCYRPTIPPIYITLPPVYIPYKRVEYTSCDICRICVEPYKSTKKRVELECGHLLCDKCLTQVININNRCPFCRVNITV